MNNKKFNSNYYTLISEVNESLSIKNFSFFGISSLKYIFNIFMYWIHDDRPYMSGVDCACDYSFLYWLSVWINMYIFSEIDINFV